MKCFQFSNGEGKQTPPVRKSTSGLSTSTASTDHDTKKSGSESNSMNVSSLSAESVGRTPFPSLSQKPNNLRKFSFEELKAATRNFSRSLMLGEGGFGCVYRGVVKGHEDPHMTIEIAVKQLSRKGLQGHKEWLTEVNVLGVVEHPNLVRLLGYCAEDDERGIQRLLVYEYMPNRSVEYHLSLRISAPLTWSMRLKIALDAARGLTYLHEGMDFQIIFRDFKTSNILLDDRWTAKLSDFGLARQGPTEGLSHVSTVVVGTIGYAAPEYIQTGRLTTKSDIWSYGVVLYELITGRRPMDRNRPKGEQKLIEWVKPYMADAKKFHLIADPRMGANFSTKSAMKLAAVANKCLIRQPKLRPKMSEVLQMVQSIVDDDEIEAPQTPLIAPNEKAKERSKRRGADSKIRIGDLKMLWREWAPKLVRAH
ncbi:probable serine/threonine-protein kinase PBL19 isoform X2 [Phalaenopsis equestris]|nr:probable serine/threonine-protein kinase PBL19 isoform X2 [Phalaenopsis equestris]XP_020589186.1 probable serine/threonine-protein kinase PBL19 isoform X2 [Phalaenopsis equestris]